MGNQAVWTDRGLLLLRAILGVVFIIHGGQKLFVYGLPGVAGMFDAMGLPLPAVNAVLITATEIGGGIALLVGAATRVAAALLAFAMGVAVVAVHLPNGFFLPQGFEYGLTLLVVNLALVLTGAGRYSVDALFGEPRLEKSAGSWKAAA
jgi:putative oxidoreductase